MRKHFSDILQDICQQYPNEPYIGSFHGTNPVLVVKDPGLLKLIFSKEFFHFNGRETSSHNRKEMLTRNMFFAHGDEWKVLRTNLTPLFSSVKLKNMFYLINNSADVLERLLEEELTTKPYIDVRCLLSKYTVDIITACAFGISSETMKNNDKKKTFTAVAVKLFDDQSGYRAVKNICRAIWPGLFYALGFKLWEDQVGEFFNNLITEEFRKREETKISRNEFVDLILTWKRSGDSLSNIKTGDKHIIVSIDVANELLVAQCLLIFGTDFETTSTSVSFLLYELAKNKIAQEKVIQEVDEYFAKHESLDFECINMMPYTESCLAESLRLYPVFSFLTRQVMHEYTLPTGFHFKKNDMVHIPVYHKQYNPQHFPEPESFRPERFLGDAKKNVKPFTYMPFGEGPRMCIGETKSSTDFLM